MKPGTTLVLGGTGKIGRRVAERLRRNLPVRIGSRTGQPPFDWHHPSTWPETLRGVDAVFISYYPDLAAPGSEDAVGTFTDCAVKSGVSRVVLLSGRGEPRAQNCERIVRDSPMAWTIVRSSWFSQNFSESFLLEPLLHGEIALPAADVGEPFVDADDVADVAAVALSEPGHLGQVYEVSGPRLWTFREAVREIEDATGRNIRFIDVSIDEYASALKDAQLSDPFVALVRYLFHEVLDGRNACVTDGITRALGRPAREFADYVRAGEASNLWTPRLLV